MGGIAESYTLSQKGGGYIEFLSKGGGGGGGGGGAHPLHPLDPALFSYS